MNTPEGNTITNGGTYHFPATGHDPDDPPSHGLSGRPRNGKKRSFRAGTFNKTLGIIGIGKIGSIVADRAKGLRMNVIAF